MLLIHFAFADSFTGVSQPLEAPVGECGVPAAEAPARAGASSVQVASQFQYWACREYRTSKTKSVYYRIEPATDGEYSHLLPAYGQSSVDEMDYRLSVAAVYQNCLRIRQLVISQAKPLPSTRCGGHP